MTARAGRAALVGTVLAALAVAAVAARSYRPFVGDEASATGRAPSNAFVDSSFTIVLCLIAALAIVALVSLPFLRGSKKRRGRASLQGLITYLVFMVVAVAIGQHVARRPFQIGQKQDTSDTVFPPTQPGVHQPRPVGHARTPEIVWPIVIGAGVLAAAVVVALYVVSRRRKPENTSAEASEAAAAELDDAIDDLRREPDPRKAVVAAYARMESALTLVGLPRRAAEAPFEYLGRAGRELQTESSMASLTASFEEAKFSVHTIGESMRDRAIAALTAVRDEVRSGA